MIIFAHAYIIFILNKVSICITSVTIITVITSQTTGDANIALLTILIIGIHAFAGLITIINPMVD
jgi:hypothetical protein